MMDDLFTRIYQALERFSETVNRELDSILVILKESGRGLSASSTGTDSGGGGSSPAPAAPAPPARPAPPAPPAPETYPPHHAPPPGIAAALSAAARRWSVPYDVLAKIAFVESSFRPDVLGPEKRNTSGGLMGLRPSTVRGLLRQMDRPVPDDDAIIRRDYINLPTAAAELAAFHLADLRSKYAVARGSDVELAMIYHLGEPDYLSGTRDKRYRELYINA